MLGPEKALPSAQAPPPPQLLLPGQALRAPVLWCGQCAPGSPYTQAPCSRNAGGCLEPLWKWPPNRCAFNLFPGQWPPCPKEAASQAGGPKIALCVRPWMGLSITARPLPPDVSLCWLALIGPLDVETGKPTLSPRVMAPQRANCNHMEVRPSALGPGSAKNLLLKRDSRKKHERVAQFLWYSLCSEVAVACFVIRYAFIEHLLHARHCICLSHPSTLVP